MNILYITNKGDGSYWWRCALPARHLARRGHTITVKTPQEAQACNWEAIEPGDAVIYCRAVSPDPDLFRGRGAKVIYDTDDNFELIAPQNCNYSAIKQVAASPAYKKILSTADLITCTTDTLAGYLNKHKTPIQVIPNSIDPDDWHVAPRYDKIRVGWQGGGSHFSDLGMILDSVKEAQKSHPFEFVLMGVGCNTPTMEEHWQNMAIWYKTMSGKNLQDQPDGKAMRWCLDKLKGVQYVYHPIVPVEEYARRISDLALDIGLAPLLDAPFNRCRSCIKFYEYSACGALTLASDVLPFNQEVPWTVRNNRQNWTQALINAVENCRKTSPVGRTWVLEHRNIQSTVFKWERAIGVETTQAALLGS